MSITGSCLCGEVKFEIDEFPYEIYKCHCSLCRKSFGGASSAATFVPLQSFRWLTSTNEQREFSSGETYKRRFCSHCGSIIPGEIKEQQLMWVPMGTLDESPPLRLAKHCYVNSKAEWEILDDQTVQFENEFDF